MTNIFLPEDFKVYVNHNNGVVLNYPEFGYEEKILPTYNYYSGEDGGYVSIYTREKLSAIYNVSEDIYVAGQVRIKGKYIGSIFYPEGYNIDDDITQDKEILAICDKYFPKLKGNMWIGGDTGGWFGLDAIH